MDNRIKETDIWIREEKVKYVGYYNHKGQDRYLKAETGESINLLNILFGEEKEKNKNETN